MHCLHGDVLPSYNRPIFEDIEDNIMIATDRTVKDRRGGAAYKIHSAITPGRACGIIPVNGHRWHTTAYCTELFGILGVIFFLYKLLGNSN